MDGGEGEVVQAGRWLAGEFLRTMALHVETGGTQAFPTPTDAVQRFGVRDDAGVVRLAEELLRREMADLPPISGRISFDAVGR